MESMKKSGKKTKMGRPPLGRDAKQWPLTVRISANERVAWSKAAKAAGMTMAMWILKPRRDEMQQGGEHGRSE